MLRSVPAPAQEQRPKRTFPEFVVAVYEDPRVDHETRELLLAVDLLTVGWKRAKHRQRMAERRSLQSLFDRPSLGEG